MVVYGTLGIAVRVGITLEEIVVHVTVVIEVVTKLICIIDVRVINPSFPCQER
jgi:hypothetical protein